MKNEPRVFRIEMPPGENMSTTEDIAEAMCEQVTEETWHKGALYKATSHNPVPTKWCMMGHLGIVWGRLSYSGHYAECDYVERLHKIIAEQYPAAVDYWLFNTSRMLSWTGLITTFNDYIAGWDDMRIILEKARGAG